MQHRSFCVPVRDLDAGDVRRHWEVPAEWVDWALTGSEASSDGTPGQMSVYLKKNGGQVLVKGEICARVTMPCARTLEPVPIALEAPILLMLAPRPPAPRDGSSPARRRRRERDPAPDEEMLSAELAAEDEYDGETIVLDDFAREHLLLELPLFPVRSGIAPRLTMPES